LLRTPILHLFVSLPLIPVPFITLFPYPTLFRSDLNWKTGFQKVVRARRRDPPRRPCAPVKTGSGARLPVRRRRDRGQRAFPARRGCRTDAPTHRRRTTAAGTRPVHAA